MVDLRERMKEVEQNDSLDLWDEIAARTPSYEERGVPLRSRVIAGVVAAGVAVTGLSFFFASFGRAPTRLTSAAGAQGGARGGLLEGGGPGGAPPPPGGVFRSEPGAAG